MRLILLLALTFGCASVPQIQGSGSVAGYALRGPIDHDVARAYLEGRRLPSALEATRREYLSSGDVPSRTALAEVSREYSPDVATLLFLETWSARADVRQLRKRFEAELEVARQVEEKRVRLEPPSDLLVLFVPGWFYRAHGAETNADFHVQRRLYEQWGVNQRLVPILENGTIEENARIVANAVRASSANHRIVLVSASKSGPEVALALGRELKANETKSVVAWLSIVGAVRGSPIADRILEPDICWFVKFQLAREGFDLRGVHSLQRWRAQKSFQAIRLPESVRTFSLIAVPLSGQISARGSFGYGVLREHGPNDGMTLLADEIIPGAVPLFFPGVDHFLGRADQSAWSLAIFRTVVGELQERKAEEGRL
ncbi:MAG: hypothetical protein ACOY0T_27255 [Myxococcota bacterium]